MAGASAVLLAWTAFPRPLTMHPDILAFVGLHAPGRARGVRLRGARHRNSHNRTAAVRRTPPPCSARAADVEEESYEPKKESEDGLGEVEEAIYEEVHSKAPPSLLAALHVQLTEESWASSNALAAPHLMPYSAKAAGGLPLWSPVGLVFCLATMVAVRQGRQEAEAAAARWGDGRDYAGARAVRRYREQAEAQERARLAAESPEERAKRQAREKARQEKLERERAEREEQRRIEAIKEAERIAAKREADRRAREEAAMAAAAELEARAAAEEKARQERDELRAKYAEEKAEEEAQQREQRDREAKERAAKLAEEKRIEQGTPFTMKLQGTITAELLPAGVDGKPGPGLRLQLQVEMGSATAFDAERGTAELEVATLAEANAACLPLCANACVAAANGHAGSVRMQNLMLSKSALDTMDEPELDQWMRVAGVRAAYVAADATEALVAETLKSRSGGPRTRTANVAVTVERNIPRREQKWSVVAGLDSVLDALEAVPLNQLQDGDNATEAEVESEPAAADLDEVEAALLKLSEAAAVVKESNPRPQEDYLKPARDKLIAVIQMEEDCNGGLMGDARLELQRSLPPRLLALVCTLAHLQDRAADRGCLPAAERLASQMIGVAATTTETDGWKSFYLDRRAREGVQDIISVAKSLFGTETVIYNLLKLHLGYREPGEEEESLPEEEWPDEKELRTARRLEVEKAMPVPERVWALRNTAQTLAGTGAPEKAREMIEEALEVKEKWIKTTVSPRLLGELEAYEQVLSMKPAWVAERAAVRARRLACCLAAADAAAPKDPVEALTVLTGALRELADDVGQNCEEVQDMLKQIQETMVRLGASLEGPQHIELQERLESSKGIVANLSERWADQLEIYRVPGKKLGT